MDVWATGAEDSARRPRARVRRTAAGDERVGGPSWLSLATWFS